MIQHNNSQLNTPYEHMVTFLLRVTEGQDYAFSYLLRYSDSYDDLAVGDQIEFCRLLSRYGYFDTPDNGFISLSALLSSVRDMIEEGGDQ